MTKEAWKLTTYSFDKVDANIADITKKAKTLKVKIHSTAIAILKHWHDNPTQGAVCAEKINALMAASPYHTKAFSVWCGEEVDVYDKKADGMVSTRMMPMRWSEEKKAWYVHKDDKITGKQFMAARDNPFWEISPAPSAAPYNDIEVLEKALATALKKAKAKKDGDVVHLGMWRKVSEAIKEAKAA